MEKRVLAIIPSAGMGRRMGFKKKTYLPLLDKPIIVHTLSVFEDSQRIEGIFVVVSPGDEGYFRAEIVERYGLRKVSGIISGGEERQDSVAMALDAATGRWDVIVVHDGARPLLTPDLLDRTVSACHTADAVVSAVPVRDTVKRVENGLVLETVPREGLWLVQTPQAFRWDVIKGAYRKAVEDGFRGTDCSGLVERMGVKVAVVMGSYENIKITTPEDITVAEAILRGRGYRK